MIRKLVLQIAVICLMLISASAHAQSGYYQEIKSSAVTFFESLSKTQKIAAGLTFADTARLKWNNLPVGLRARAGLSIGQMTNDQRILLHHILSISLSSQGYLKATSILHLDDLLNMYTDSLYYKKEVDQRTHEMFQSLKWSHKNFYFAFFGQPGDKTWGYKLEGHHLSVNFTFVNEQVSVTPFFIGTDPAEFPTSEYAGWRVLGQEEDLGLRLINNLSPTLRKKATMDAVVPGDIFTSAESGKRLVDNWGILSSEMSAEQQKILQQIVREFVFNLEYDKAVLEFDKIQNAGLDKIYFGWIGAYKEHEPHYYVINGPTFIIEFDNNGGPRRSANHIHAIWREKGNEYGEDVLKAHYKASH